MATKTELLSTLNGVYNAITPPQGNPELMETVGACKKYLFHHLDTGFDEEGSPIARKAFKVFFVMNEGEAEEAAYLENKRAESLVDKKISAVNPSSPTAIEIYNLYKSELVRDKVKGLMVRAANDIYNEDVATANHTERMKWAVNVIKSLDDDINVMMSFIAMNAVVLGGSYTDEDLRYLVNSNIDKWALTSYGA